MLVAILRVIALLVVKPHWVRKRNGFLYGIS